MCLIGFLHPWDHNPRRITKGNKDFAKRHKNFKVKVGDIQKIEKTNSFGISAFGYENKEKHITYVSKNVLKKNMLIYY